MDLKVNNHPKLQHSNLLGLRIAARAVFLFSLAAFASFQAKSQCEGLGETLCADSEPVEDELLVASPINLCAEALNFSTIYEFFTNDGMTVSGGSADEVSVLINNVATTGTEPAEVFVSIMTINPYLPCDISNAQPVSGTTCESTMDLLTIEASNLLPMTTYFVVVGTENDSITYDINLEGSAVDIDACCDEQVRQGIEVTLEGAAGGTDYQWTPVEVVGTDQFELETPTFTPQESVTITLTGTVGNCSVTDQIFIEVLPPVSPFNGFTPNGDGVNDLWILPGVAGFNTATNTITVSVFDRWGQQVFKSIGYQEPWDGTNKGKRLPTGAYYYVIEIRSSEVNIEPIVGQVSIIH